MLFGFNQKIWFYQSPIDFRKQIDGLVLRVADLIKQDPTSGQLFMFRNRQANKLKLLFWDQNGFWLLYKRLEKGRFKLPSRSDNTLEISRDELGALLSGLDFTKQKFLPEVTVKKFY